MPPKKQISDTLQGLRAASLSTPQAEAKDKPKTPPQKPVDRKTETIKRSIALQAADVERLDQIETILRQSGAGRIAFSRLIQIAIKTSSLEAGELLEALEACKETDGRRTWDK